MTDRPERPDRPGPSAAEPAPGGPQHTDVGAYVLGLLEPAERAAFERHLAGCPQCTAQARRLGPVEPLLAEYAASARAAGREPADPVPQPSGQLLDRLVAEVTAGRRRGRVRRLVLALAATALVAAGPVVTAAVVTGGSAPGVVAVAEQHTATDPATGAKATVGLDRAAWGTQVSLQLSGVQGPLTCRLVAVPRAGHGPDQTVTSWTVPAAGGYASPGGPDVLRTSGGTGLQPGEIDHFEVRVQGTGALLVAVPARAG
ncbi:zf-HC2 domain-containing protein [Kitasatospora sp. NPDC094028]